MTTQSSRPIRDAAIPEDWYRRRLERRIRELRAHPRTPALERELARTEVALERLADGNCHLCIQCRNRLDEHQLLSDPSWMLCERCGRNDVNGHSHPRTPMQGQEDHNQQRIGEFMHDTQRRR